VWNKGDFYLGEVKVIDLHLKSCIAGQKCKNNITGRNPQEKEVKALSENPHSKTILKGKDLW